MAAARATAAVAGRANAHIGTRSSIYALLRRVAADGVACVVVSSDFEEVIGIADRAVVLSDGISVTDIPSHLVDIERLAMFAAPRSSAERTHTVLETLAAEFGGTAYWIDVDGPRVFCFDRVDGPLALDPGFAGGCFPQIAETLVPRALTTMGDSLIAEYDGRLHSLLVPVHGRRGHRLGLFGLTLARAPPDFDANAVRQRVMADLTHGAKPQDARVARARQPDRMPHVAGGDRVDDHPVAELAAAEWRGSSGSGPLRCT